MARPEIKASPRFSRAARAEQDRLNRQRVVLVQRRDGLQARLDALNEELATIDQRLDLLDDLAGASDSSRTVRKLEPANDAGGLQLVGGAAIRDIALPLLLRTGDLGPIHYREWYRLFNESGYAAAGKRPDAVFLNQVSRSPVVKSTTKSGYYVLDTNVDAELREQLRGQQIKLGELLEDNVPGDGTSLAAHQDRQRELTAAIAKTERDLREALRVLEAGRQQRESSDPSDLTSVKAA